MPKHANRTIHGGCLTLGHADTGVVSLSDEGSGDALERARRRLLVAPRNLCEGRRDRGLRRAATGRIDPHASPRESKHGPAPIERVFVTND